jgi:L-iditol 2-dehydrogenase
MRSIVYYAPRDIRLVDAPVPRPGAGEVLVKIGAALTCATDFKAYRQGHKLLLPTLPSRFGHEFAGTVAAVGSGVTAFAEGDRVVAGNSAPCDRCFYCAKGQMQLCDRLSLHNGGYAEYDCLPAAIVRHKLHKIPASLSFADAALAEPLAAAIHGVDALKVEPGETVGIVGAGPMAILLIHALRAKGARVFVLGRGKENLERARAAGADRVVSSLQTGFERELLPAAASGRGLDCVFEAVGRPETWQQAIALARKGGRVCLFGGCAPGTQVPVDAHRVHYDELSLFGVFHHNPAHFAAAVDLLAAGGVKTGLLVQGTLPLAELPAYFERMHDKPGPKVAVLP